MLDLLKGGLIYLGMFILGVLILIAASLIFLTYMFWESTVYFFRSFVPKIAKKSVTLLSWILKRFADIPFVLVMIGGVYIVRRLIAVYDPEAALSFLDVWDKIAQAGLLTAMFALAFFLFLYFDFRPLFRYIYPEKSSEPNKEHSLKSDFQQLKPWQRLVSIPVSFCLLLWLFQLCLKVMQALA